MELVYVVVGGIIGIIGEVLSTHHSSRLRELNEYRNELVSAYAEWSGRFVEAIAEWRELIGTPSACGGSVISTK